jgi:hypothetical protein
MRRNFITFIISKRIVAGAGASTSLSETSGGGLILHKLSISFED